MVNLAAIFEVRSIACYGDMKGVKIHKMRWFGEVRGQGPPRVIGNITIRQSTYDFLFVFNRNYASILYRFGNTVSYLSKFANFDLSHLRFAPSLGVTSFEFRKDFWHQKTRVPGLSCGIVCMFLCLAISLDLRPMTDGLTDRHTSMAYTVQSIARAVINSCPL